MKLKQKIEAIKLRRQGYSLNEIVDHVGVSKSTASLWVNNVKMSDSAKKRLESRISAGQIKSRFVLRQKREKRDSKTKSKALNLIKGLKLNNKNTILLCAMIYWCEGTKNVSGGVHFTNSDPNLIRCFLSLLRRSFKLDESKFRVCMHLHSYHNETKQKIFWSKVAGVQEGQFIKSHRKKNSGPRVREGYPGCIRISYYDTVVSRTLNFIAQEFMDKGPIG